MLQDPLFAESPPILLLVTRLLPDSAVEWLADRFNVNYTANNREAHDRLVNNWLDTIQKVETEPLTQVVQQAPLSVMGLVCGTCRTGSDSASSVVNLEGRSHQIANLWIADASTLPGCPAVGPGLTVIANGLRIAAHLNAALG